MAENKIDLVQVPNLDKNLELCQSVLDNALLLSEILSSLSPSDLKNVRLVNTTWNRQSSRWFYAKTAKKIPKDCNNLEQDPGFPSHCKNTTLKIKKQGPISQLAQNRSNYHEKIMSYLVTKGGNVRTLKIDLNILDFNILLRMLPHLLNLFELKIKLSENVNEYTRFPAKLPTNGFAAVKSFSINDRAISKIPWRLYENFIVSLVGMFSSLEQLKVTQGANGNIQNNILDAFKKNPNILNGIKKFAAPFVDTGDVSFQMYQGLLDLPFQQSLTSLEFSLIPFESGCEPKDTSVVTELLKKFSSTLESLSISVGMEHFRNRRYGILTYVIPPLPELKTLKLKSYEQMEYIGRPVSNHGHWLNFEDLEGHKTEVVDYKQMFPKLNTLVFKDASREIFNYIHRIYSFENRLMTPFLQGEVKCLSVRTLEFPKDKINKNHYQNWLVRLSEIFPNVHSPLFRYVRNGEFHLLEDG